MRKATLILASLFLSIFSLNAQVETGTAVYYADALNGQRTAFGEVYRMDGYSAAHKSYPLGTVVRVTNTANNRSVNVRVNDRIAANSKDIISLSKAAARQIGLVESGRATVRVERAGYSPANPYASADSPYASAPPSSYNYYGDAPNPYSNMSPDVAPKGYGNPETSASLRAASYILPPTTFGFGIQLASFKKVENAVEHLEKMKANNIENAYIWQKDGNNRVVIASFPDKVSAGRYLDALKSRYRMNGIVVRFE
ncbi:MAG: septal ring lytic transglycosylase RlpA family protein [Phaeodactylibacter sp.]|nr:septal ring lytic transglycosylase RlpA family protein [Phaeodactylibacter sp.]MCB9292236.1 septal ring lytic transglycosylase RlpA family protein [Lewinellaceae bacterium]